MPKFVFTVDGIEYKHIHVVSVKRSFSVLDGENAGRTMDGAMQRDIIGTYYNYSMEIDPDGSTPDEYNSLYEVLSAPQNSHSISFPYGNSVLTFDAYISNGEDELWDSVNGENRWDNLSINFVAMNPQRRPA